MVSHYDDPVFLGGSQYSVQPLQLVIDVLLAGIGVFVVLLAVLVNEGSSVQPYDAYRSTFFAEGFGVVAGRHLPATAHAGVVEYGLCRAAVFMIATDGIPVNHQFRVAVDQFVIGHPQWIVDRTYPFEVVDVSGSNYEFRAYFFSHCTHQFGNRLLVVIPVASQVVGHIDIEFVVIDRVVYFVLGSGPLT